MKELSTFHSASDILAVVKKPNSEGSDAKFILAIDGVQDPGNLGTMIRTADWFGVDKIICSKETVDIFNSKVIQSSMGSLFRIPIVYADLAVYLCQSKLLLAFFLRPFFILPCPSAHILGWRGGGFVFLWVSSWPLLAWRGKRPG